MSHWDAFRELRRLLESLEPLKEQIQQMQELNPSLKDLKSTVRTLDLIRPYDDLLAAIARMDPMLDLRESLANAIKPFPDFSELYQRAALASVQGNFDQLNAAIREAAFIAEVDVEARDYDTEDELEERLEAELIEVASPEMLERLRRVEFAPFTILDRVLRNPEAMRALGARQFEEFVAALVEELGFEDVVLTERSGDRGRDVLATKRLFGISIICAFECKCYAEHLPIGPDIMRALLGAIRHPKTPAAKGVLVTTSRFTAAATNFILTEPSLHGVDYERILAWLDECAIRRRN